MGRYCWLLLVGVLLAWPGTARATTGGDHEIEMLGYAPGEHKIFFLLYHLDASDDPSELYFVKTEGPHAGRVFEVRSWYRDFDDPSVDDPHDRFATRLERLRKRLVPMETPATKTFSSAASVTDTRPNPAVDADLWNPAWDTEYELEIAVFPVDDPSDQTTVGPVVSYGPDVELVKEYRAPGTNNGIVIVRFFTDPWEYGYDTELAVPVTYPTK